MDVCDQDQRLMCRRTAVSDNILDDVRNVSCSLHTSAHRRAINPFYCKVVSSFIMEILDVFITEFIALSFYKTFTQADCIRMPLGFFPISRVTLTRWVSHRATFSSLPSCECHLWGRCEQRRIFRLADLSPQWYEGFLHPTYSLQSELSKMLISKGQWVQLKEKCIYVWFKQE